MLPQHFDVVIVGAGLAGTALAAALGGSTLRVALIEAQPLSLDWPTLHDNVDGFDNRVSALTKTSQRWLDQLGAWPLLATRRIAAYRHMQVWDGEGTGAINFDADAVNQPMLGHIVENNLLQTALLRNVTPHRNVQIFSPARVAGFTRLENRIDIALEDGKILRPNYWSLPMARIRACASGPNLKCASGTTRNTLSLPPSPPNCRIAKPPGKYSGARDPWPFYPYVQVQAPLSITSNSVRSCGRLRPPRRKCCWH